MANAIKKLIVNSTDSTDTESIAEKIFVIPHYQRGYRWTANEAKRLLEDLLIFADSNETEYCLQPIVLQAIEKNKTWKEFPENNNKDILRVVDGQQRLTTIAIIMDALGINKAWDIYYIAEQKTLSMLLKENITINDHFRNAVKDVFGNCSKEEKTTISNLFKTPSKSVSFLRYDIDTKEDDEGHSIFLRLNDGKTPLTSSELIRALYMVNSSGIFEHERIEIAKEWEIIENTLRDEQFWLMFNSRGLSNTPTRIDLLFALVMDVNLEHAKANPRIIFEAMDNPKLDLEIIWQNVLRCFWWMQSCYSDIELFNYLCWINEFTDISAKTIYDQWRQNPKNFKEIIIGIIQEKYAGKRLQDFNYDCEKRELRKLFVLLNLLECQRSKERFRFDLYKNESWDIEHIDSQTPNELKDSDSKRDWLNSVYDEFQDDAELKKIVCGFEKNKELPNDFDDMATKITMILDNRLGNEKISDANAIGNLALLNTHINRAYKNAIFPAKRKKIKEFIVTGDCYIPPCTAKAFMKFYTEAPSKITYWLRTDFEKYSEQMATYFSDFMKLPSKNMRENTKIETKNYLASQKVVTCNNLSPHQISSHRERFSGPVTFITFMDKYQVIIPKIQRLYVQGRLDSYGQKCCSSFASHLVDCVTTEKKTCLLDFIYGIDNENGKIFYPIDGQQRLTTLLLLAWLCGETNNKEWTFRYEARRANMQFIEGLLKHSPPELGKLDDITACSSIIKKSDWFLPVWLDDPGIAGMLRMLDSLYNKLSNSKQKFYFTNITFFVNYLDTSVKSYDEIFLKMNSRGKPLTDWENIKAVLDKNIPDALHDTWQELNNCWQEWLWEKLNKESWQTNQITRLDTKMLSVIELALACAGYKEKIKDNMFQLAHWLEKKENDDSRTEFYNLCMIFFSALDDSESDDKKTLPMNWKKAHLRPDFTKDDSESFLKPLIVYYAEKKSYNKDWIRVVWNIVENSKIDKINFPSAFKLIEELSTYRECILDFFANKENKITSEFASEQVKEEREKARQIVNPPRDCKWNCNGPNCWEIQEAENFAFFKGAIRFLYTNAEGKVDWSQFKQKFENAKQYFAGDGVSTSYRGNAILLRRFLSHMDLWEQWWQLKYDSTKDNWHDILLNKNLRAPVHKLLIQNDSKQFDFKSYKSTFHNDERKKFLTEFLIQEQVLKELPAGWKLVWRQSWDGGEGGGVYDLDPQTRGNHPYFIIHPRLKLLADEEIGLVNIKRNGYYIPGVDIEFQYNECNFRWLIARNGNECEVYLLDEENNYAKRRNPKDDSEGDMYYCVNIFKSYFDFEQEKFQEKFKHALETLIKACKDEG